MSSRDVMLDFDDRNDWAANWAAFDRFVRDWLRTDFARDVRSPEIRKLEKSAGVTLPASAREWCAFALASRKLAHFTWRDCLVVEPVPEHDATALLIQGEADYYWAIQNERLTQADPPVTAYSLDCDSDEPAFVLAGLWAPRVTAFALDYFLSYLQSPGGGFAARQSCESFDRRKLLTDFGEPRRFGHLELFHSDGVLVVLGGLPPSWRNNVVNVEIQTPRPMKRLPPSVRALLKDAHVLHGGLKNPR